MVYLAGRLELTAGEMRVVGNRGPDGRGGDLEGGVHIAVEMIERMRERCLLQIIERSVRLEFWREYGDMQMETKNGRIVGRMSSPSLPRYAFAAGIHTAPECERGLVSGGWWVVGGG